MELFYYLVFGGFGAVVAALELSKTSKDRINTSTSFNAFKNNYLVVYSLMMGSICLLPLQPVWFWEGGNWVAVYCWFWILYRGFDQQWLSLTFSKPIFLGNGLVAILSGLFGNLLVDSFSLGPVAPFDAAACFLAIDEKIALLGAIQSLFEGSMYTFVFLWTPALSPNNEEIPHGFIFATFMLASMLGSSVASRLMACSSLKVESYMQIVFLISAVSLFIPVGTNVLVSPSTAKGGSISFSGYHSWSPALSEADKLPLGISKRSSSEIVPGKGRFSILPTDDVA
ncbi:Molybdate-anion transporter [Camellia lanceoleosa]|uniref:Molybdate-anion transporter n=1 Tax=Camellia lanceoleosa TaxID=1840588 RepID=A0ACC0G514_9ERIC|nr:Molybdate-anion transporter [Camellia lanceoleosa]